MERHAPSSRARYNERVIEDSVFAVVEAGIRNLSRMVIPSATVEATRGHTAGRVMICAKGAGANRTGLSSDGLRWATVKMPVLDLTDEEEQALIRRLRGSVDPQPPAPPLPPLLSAMTTTRRGRRL